MNDALFMLYLADVSSVLKMIAGISLGTFAGAAFLGGMWVMLDGDRDFQKLLNFAKRPMKWYFLFLLIALLLPTDRFLYIAAGLSVGEEIAQTEIAGKAYELLNTKLDEMLIEAKGE